MKDKKAENKKASNVWQQLKKNCAIIGPEVERKLFEKSFFETLSESPGAYDLINEYGKKNNLKNKDEK